MKKNEIFLWLSFCDMTTFKKQCTVPVTLTFDLCNRVSEERFHPENDLVLTFLP